MRANVKMVRCNENGVEILRCRENRIERRVREHRNGCLKTGFGNVRPFDVEIAIRLVWKVALRILVLLEITDLAEYRGFF